MIKKQIQTSAPVSSLFKNRDHSKAALSPLQKKLLKKASQPKVSARDVLLLCKRGLSLQGIAQRLAITPLSAAIYIERLLRKRHDIRIDTFVEPEKRGAIEEALLSLQTSSVKRIVAFLGGKASEEEIRIVRGFLQGKDFSE